jgi:hypothetical protein
LCFVAPGSAPKITVGSTVSIQFPRETYDSWLLIRSPPEAVRN